MKVEFMTFECLIVPVGSSKHLRSLQCLHLRRIE
jgi:hypothetical protein